MKFKFLAALCLFVTLSSCKETQEEAQDAARENQTQDITEKDISEINYIEFTLDVKTEKAVENWEEYYTLQNAINNIKKADLSFFANAEDIKTTLKSLKENIPDAVNAPSIIVRINAFETKLHKLESLYNLPTITKPEFISSIKEFFVSFSTLNFQLNKKIENDSRVIVKP